MIRIAITGPESSGKTTLATALASQIGATYLPEYARLYLEAYGSEYEQEDLDIMATGHLNSIKDERDDKVVVDTDFVVFKVWSDYKYNFTSAYINECISENWFDIHFLCAPDIPWEKDPLRENPDDRADLFARYVENLERYRKNYIILQGSHEDRMKKALKELSRFERNL